MLLVTDLTLSFPIIIYYQQHQQYIYRWRRVRSGQNRHVLTKVSLESQDQHFFYLFQTITELLCTVFIKILNQDKRVDVVRLVPYLSKPNNLTQFYLHQRSTWIQNKKYNQILYIFDFIKFILITFFQRSQYKLQKKRQSISSQQVQNQKMINIIEQDGTINQDLCQFPTAQANIAIFGTQSSGKSTLVNNAFGTAFPVLDTKQDRRRCTRGVWFQNVNNFNIIDTEGFDSVQRKAQEKILQKQIALFCLALADVVIINMWMNEVGRYEGSHSHILKAIIKVSQRLVSAKEKKIIFVVKDCTQDADRKVLREQLSFNVNSIISQVDTHGKSVKLNIDYYFMSHYHYKRQQYQKQAKQLKNILKVRRSYLANYSSEDRVVYIRDLWQKITSAQNQVDLKSVQDALRNYALQRIKNSTLETMKQQINSIQDLNVHKSLQRLLSFINKQAKKMFLSQKPAHIPEKQVQRIILQIKDSLYYAVVKHFNNKILPLQEEKLLKQLQKSLQKEQQSRKLEKVLIKKRKQITDLYKKIIIGHKQSLSLVKQFSQKINEIVVKYQRQIAHLFNVFQSKLQKRLNDQLDRQLNQSTLVFNGEKINQKIKEICKQFQYNQWQINFKDMWQKISHRSIHQKLPQRVDQLSHQYVQSYSVWTGDRTTNIIAFHKKIQKDCEEFCRNVMNFFEEETLLYQPADKLKDQIQLLMTKALIKQRTRFHITLILVGVFMWFFYGEFRYFLRSLPMKKKKRRYWLNFYMFAMFLILLIAFYNRRHKIKRWLGMA